MYPRLASDCIDIQSLTNFSKYTIFAMLVFRNYIGPHLSNEYVEIKLRFNKFELDFVQIKDDCPSFTAEAWI